MGKSQRAKGNSLDPWIHLMERRRRHRRSNRYTQPRRRAMGTIANNTPMITINATLLKKYG